MVCKCRYTRPQEKAFIRPKSDSVTDSVRVLIQSKPILSSTSPVLAYALGKSSTVDLDILKNKEVAINFTSSGSIPKIEAELKKEEEEEAILLEEPLTYEFNGYNIEQLREYLTARKVNFTESDDRNALIIKVFEYRQKIGWVEVGEDGE